MKQKLLRTLVACATGLALSTQAQSSSSSAGGSATDPSSGSSGTTSTYPGSSTTTPGSSSYSGSSSSQSGLGHHLSATGRMSHEPVRGSQLTGAQVSNSSGSQIGTVSDTIINPASGRLEFAVISLSGNGTDNTSSTSSSPSSSSSATPSSTAAGSTSASSLGSGKQVAVPWMLLRPSSAGAVTSAASSSAATSGSSSPQPSFVFAGDTSKLQSAPNFDANTDLSQPSWRQSVFSYFGLMGGSSATGAAETPGGFSGSSSGSTTPDSTQPQSSQSPRSSSSQP